MLPPKNNGTIMKKILLAAFMSMPLLYSSPAISQVSVQINIGNPAVRPWPDGVWVPGYYTDRPEGGRRVWTSGKWRHDNGHHYGQNKERGHGKHGNNHGNDNGNGKDHGNGKGHGNEN
jgi:hypothetical protein